MGRYGFIRSATDGSRTSIRTQGRQWHLVFISLSAMALLGMTVGILTTLDQWNVQKTLPVLWFIFLLICSIVGAGVGLLSSPVIIVCLQYKNARVSVPIVFGCAYVITILYIPQTAGGPLFYFWLQAALTAFLSACAISIMVMISLPNRYVPARKSRHCPRCDYDLRGGNTRS